MAHKRNRADFEAERQATPYVFYGTALPPLDGDARDDGSYVPVWQQEVRDERGRKRLHGAFTGGFSAGYFNTVGSKEGWTPSTFVSSRTNRHKDVPKQPQRRAEDYMDEEDLADAAEAQKLQTKNTFAGLGSTENDGLRKGMIVDLLRPTGETMGVKLLQRMGWRPGQGVGPKVRRKARSDDAAGAEDGKEDEHLLAPDDSPMISFVRKTDHKGLGYEGEAKLASLNHDDDVKDNEDDAELLAASRKKHDARKDSSRPTGFGMGVLSDTGSDEEDPYELGPKLSFNRTIGGDKKKNKKSLNDKSSAKKFSNPLLRSKPVFISKSKASAKGFRKCHDGRLPLNGFLLSTPASPTESAKYPPPQIPADWKSSKQPSGQPPTTTTTTPYQSPADAARASTLDPKSRAALLGESTLPGKSVFDYLSPAARARLVSASGREDLPNAGNEPPPPGFATTATSADTVDHDDAAIPHLERDTALAALGRGAGGWMPYADEPAKRERYRAFLEHAGGLREGGAKAGLLWEAARAAGLGREEWRRELAEFAHAARVFRPMRGLMASRFASASSGAGPQAGGDRAEGEREGAGDEELVRAGGKPKDAAEEAAQMGMFGPMTRSELRFYPSRLMCKRFGVKPPAHVVGEPGVVPGDDEKAREKSKLDVVGKKVMDEMMMEAAAMDPNRLRGAKGGEGEAQKEVKLSERAVVDVERNEALEAEKAGEAVFKAVFGSDDDEDE
ncbi:MAG: hypothetical protein M1821_007713 [Bathelium mastoideum]|nr:MAG: hypothetical protein M1821_007713 [Bathelium mastoideum]